jgi:hypothetical protein
MFMIWLHGPEKLDNLLYHLNSILSNIQFTMETEKDGHLSFSVVDKQPDGSLGLAVFRKATYTNLCLNDRLHHHPASKCSVLSILPHTTTMTAPMLN